MLQFSNLSYEFPGNHVRALDGVELSLEPGCIHALLGENGAGKSTLARLVCGHLGSWLGSMTLNGRPYHPRSPRHALQNGVALVPQHPRLALDLDVGKNLFLGHGLDDHHVYSKSIKTALAERMDQLGIDLDLDQPARSLDASRIHWSAIAEALLASPGWIFLDEPSAAYPETEIQRLYGLLADLARAGMGVVVITHRLREVETFAQTCHIMRQGRLVASRKIAGFSREESIFSLMFPGAGNSLPSGNDDLVAAPQTDTGTPAMPGLAIHDLYIPVGHGRHCILDTHIPSGAIMGILGHWDQGLESLEDVLAGMQTIPKACIRFKGHPLKTLAASQRGYIPSRRFQRGIGVGMSIKDTALIRLRSKLGVLNQKQSLQEYEHLLPLPPGRDWNDPIETLSGGMIQKIIVTRELDLPRPSLLICAEPWWGLDFQAQNDFKKKLDSFVSTQSLALILSSDIDEILSLCTHVMVLGPQGLSPVRAVADTQRTELENLLFHPHQEAASC